MKKKKSKPTYSKLKKRLDQVFSEYVRRRFHPCKCVTCGIVKPWKEMHCGHFQKRHYLATRWHLENCHVQCPACNVFRAGAMAEYAVYGVNRYGPDWPSRMVALSKVPTKYSRSDLQDMITEFEQRIARLTGDWRE